MKIFPYLMFNGQAEQAAHFYAEALGGKIGERHRYADFPPVEGAAPLSEEYKQRIGHACVGLPGGTPGIGLADTLSSDTPDFGSGHMLTLNCESVEQAEKSFAFLSAGALKIACPLQEAFFAKRYGELTDRFGVQWAVMFEG